MFRLVTKFLNYTLKFFSHEYTTLIYGTAKNNHISDRSTQLEFIFLRIRAVCTLHSGDETNKKPGRPSKKGATLTSGIRNVRDNDIKLSCTLLHELCPILNMNFDLWRVKADSCLWKVALADFNYSLYVHVFVGGGGGEEEGNKGGSR